MNDENIRVRYAAISSIALLCTELSPEIQKQHHKEIIESLWKTMDHENIKLRTRAVGCLVNFCKGIMDDNESILEPYAGTLLEKLASLFEQSLMQNYMPLQSEVLSCMSVIAATIRDKFAEYYNKFIPGLKNLLGNTPMTTLKQKELRANTIKTIGNMLYAVSEIKQNKEVIINDAKEIIVGLLTLMKSKLSDDDPQTIAINNFWGEVTYVLGESFAEYLPNILPTLFEYINADTNAKISDSQNPVKNYNKGDMVIGINGVDLSVNTQAFQSKIMAGNVLIEICANLKKAFRPYTEDMSKAVISLLNCKSSGTLKRIGAKSFKCLLMTCTSNDEMVKVFNFIYPTLKQVLLGEIKCETYKNIKSFLKELCNAMRLFADGPQMFSDADMIDFCNVLDSALLCFIELQKDKITSLKTSKKLDEEEKQEINDEIEKIGKITTHVMEICGIIGKLYRMKAQEPFFSKLIPRYVYIWENAGESERLSLAAICFFCDVVEYFHEASFHSELSAQVLQKFLAQMGSSNRDIIQSAGYGIGVIAQHAQAQFKAVLPSVLQILLKIVQEPDSRSEEKGVCTECIIGAIGKICLFHFGHELVGTPLVHALISVVGGVQKSVVWDTPLDQPMKHDQQLQRLVSFAVKQLNISKQKFEAFID